MRKTFRITPAHHARAVEHLVKLLADVEEGLADGRQSILGGDEINFSDIAFAAIMGLWIMPPAFGGGRADAVRIEPDRCPAAMQAEISTWKQAYPLATAFVERLYAEQRSSAPGQA